MRLLVGTRSGLLAVEGSEVSTVDDRPARAISGRWTIHDDAVVDRSRDVAQSLDGLSAHCVLEAEDGGALVGTSDAHVVHVSGSGVEPVESFDRIPTRDGWYTPWGAPPDTRSLTRSDDGALLVNVHVGGVWRDDGERWTEVVDVDRDTHQVVAEPRTDIVAIAAAIGVGLSRDDGRTFTWTADGLHASYCRAIAVAGEHVVVTASTGPSTRDGGVYRRPIDDDGPFERVSDGLPDPFPFNLDTFQLAARGDDAVLGTRAGDVFVSQDAGRTWDVAVRGLDPVFCVALD